MFPRLTDEEIARLYPADLSLRLVQVVHRHGERTPIRRRLENLIPPNWRMCYAASGLHSVVLQLLHEPRSGIEEPHTGAHPAHEGAPPKFLSGGSRAQYRRILETFPEKKNGTKNQLVTVIEQGGCYYGQLTDKGRSSLSRSGSNLRALYIDRLGLLPPILEEGDKRIRKALYLRSTDYARTFESLQQLVTSGMYPPSKRDPLFVFDIHTRANEEDNMFADGNCRYLRKLIKQAKIASKEEMEPNIKRLQERFKDIIPDLSLEGDPNILDTFDTFTAAAAHDVPLPAGVQANDLLDIEKIVTHQWFTSLIKSAEMRRLWIGRLVEEISRKMNAEAENKGDGLRMAVYSGHDSTIAPLTAAFGAFDNRWPPFSSTVVFELFEEHGNGVPGVTQAPTAVPRPLLPAAGTSKESPAGPVPDAPTTPGTTATGRQPFFVRVRHDDRLLQLPGCAAAGKHRAGDLTMCTLEAFLEIADEAVPKDYDAECKAVPPSSKQ